MIAMKLLHSCQATFSGPPKLKLWVKLVLSTIVLIMIFQPNFSIRYKYIPLENISKELLKLTHSDVKNQNLPICEYKIIRNGAPIEIPNFKLPVKLEEDDIDSGEYYPKHCRPLYSTAILVPHRNRTEQLELFLPYMHNFLRRQEIHYRIFVVHQGDTKPWNKGKLFNAGVRVAMDLGFQCLILHDVDMLPLHQANMFACTSQPRHMSANIDKFRYNLIYEYLVGGALAITVANYKKVNGYSNKFEMWGGEDDEFSNRIYSENLKIQRFPPDLSRYTMMIHKHEPINNNRGQLIRDNNGKHKEDGLNNVHYKKLTILHNRLYTNITVEL